MNTTTQVETGNMPIVPTETHIVEETNNTTTQVPVNTGIPQSWIIAGIVVLVVIVAIVAIASYGSSSKGGY